MTIEEIQAEVRRLTNGRMQATQQVASGKIFIGFMAYTELPPDEGIAPEDFSARLIVPAVQALKTEAAQIVFGGLGPVPDITPRQPPKPDPEPEPDPES